MRIVDQGEREVFPTPRLNATSLHFCLTLGVRHYRVCAWLSSKNPDLSSSDLVTSMFHPQVPVRGFLRDGTHPKDASVYDNDRLPMSTIPVGYMHVIATTPSLT